MGVTYCFPSVVPLSVCLYSFTMANTAFYPNFFIPAFADICVNMKSVATFMNEPVSHFDTYYLIKKCPRLVCLTIKRHDQSVYSCSGVLLFWSTFRASQDFIVFIFWEHFNYLIDVLHES